MKDLNPYEELGLERTASPQAIKSAYRAQAKVHHPDVGGDEAAWERMRLAYSVLSDPGRRKTYDDTGRIEEDRPDNDRAAALQVIEMHMSAIINAFIGSGFAPADDPRLMDVVEHIQRLILAEIGKAEEGIRGGRNVAMFMEDMRARFTIKEPGDDDEQDPITRGFDRQIAHARQQIADLEMNIRVRKLAHQIIGGYDYRAEESLPVATGAKGIRMHLDPGGMVEFS